MSRLGSTRASTRMYAYVRFSCGTSVPHNNRRRGGKNINNPSSGKRTKKHQPSWMAFRGAAVLPSGSVGRLDSPDAALWKMARLTRANASNPFAPNLDLFNDRDRKRERRTATLSKVAKQIAADVGGHCASLLFGRRGMKKPLRIAAPASIE